MEAEERGQAEAIARNLYEMSALKVPILCMMIGVRDRRGVLQEKTSVLDTMPENCVLLVSYFGYNCGMMGVVFLLIRFYNLADICSFLSQLLSFH